MYNRLLCTFNRLKSFLNDMFSCLCQHLNGHVVRNQILLNQSTAKFIFCLGCSREPHLNLFESNLYQHLEKCYLLLQAHRNNQCLISIPQVHTTPNRSFIDILFFCPVHTLYRRHIILSFVLIVIHHLFISSFYTIPCFQSASRLYSTQLLNYEALLLSCKRKSLPLHANIFCKRRKTAISSYAVPLLFYECHFIHLPDTGFPKPYILPR